MYLSSYHDICDIYRETGDFQSASWPTQSAQDSWYGRLCLEYIWLQHHYLFPRNSLLTQSSFAPDHTKTKVAWAVNTAYKIN